MPGRAWRSAWLAVLRSTRSALAGAGAAGLVAAGLSPAFCACARTGANSSARTRGRPRRIRPSVCPMGMVPLLSHGRRSSTGDATAIKSSCEPPRGQRRRSPEGLDRLDDLVGVSLHADLGPVLHDLAVLADEDGGPDDALHLLAVHDLVAPGAIGLEDAAVGVAEQGKSEAVLVAELAVRGDRVLAGAEHDGAELLERGEGRVEVVGLDRATRRVVSRVEVEDHDLAGEVG